MSSTKTSSSKEIEEIKDTNTENMDNHSIWYGRLKKILKMLNYLKNY